MNLREEFIDRIDIVGLQIITRWDNSGKSYNDYKECIDEINDEINKAYALSNDLSLLKWFFAFGIKVLIIFVVLLICVNKSYGVDDELNLLLFVISMLFAYQSQENKWVNNMSAKSEFVIILQKVAQNITCEYLETKTHD